MKDNSPPNQRIQGAAPILNAQAAAWNVRANAYTQSAKAELMRVCVIASSCRFAHAARWPRGQDVANGGQGDEEA